MTATGPVADRNRRWATRLVQACLTAGCDQFFLAPGSRCTPLTLAVAACPASHVIQHFDERGLAFACLGYGRATGRAGVFICTSGTAVANAWPAVVEAFMDGVPMLLLTADRPPELRDTGANQTIDQQQIFGRYARFFFDLPCPDEQIPDALADSVIRQAALHASSGPAHVNCMFREPLGGADVAPVTPVATQADLPSLPQWRGSLTIEGGDTLVVVGGCRADETAAARRLSERLACPLLADITTGMRGLAYDLQLLRPEQPVPETIIHVGGRIVSKRWWQWLDQHPPRQWFQLIGRGRPVDPVRRGPEVVAGPLVPVCDGLVALRPSSRAFREVWQRNSELARAVAQDVLDAAAGLHEPGLAQRLAGCLPPDHGLLLGNSMPIRDMDSFGFWSEHRHVAVAANRGASGIDGLLGSAVGFAAGLDRPVTAVIGDLSLLHDLNSLAMVSSSRRPLVVIVINNNGGGIFHFLSIADATATFEQFFATPHGFSLEHAARLFGLDYVCPRTWAEFDAGYRLACRSPRSTLIEVRTDRHDNLKLHRQVEQAIRDGQR